MMVSFSDACKELNISCSTMKNWIRLGKISALGDFFDKEEIQRIKNSGKLQSRRNKTMIEGNIICRNYLTDTNNNYEAVCRIVNSGYEFKSIAAFYARKFFGHDFYKYKNLVEDLCSPIPNFSDLPELQYSPFEDILGWIYISMKHIGERKKDGVYYTPDKIVKMINISAGKCLDPCCGTGNFLLHCAKSKKIEELFGIDTDETAVKIARINLALIYRPKETDILYKNIKNADFLNKKTIFRSVKSFENIIGNPPWGSQISEDIFLKHSIEYMSLGGLLTFVLPESILNVAAHKQIRKFITENTSIKKLDYLGNIFDNVHCPSALLTLCKEKFSLIGTVINNSFTIKKERTINDIFNLNVTDKEYEILNNMSKNCVTLKNNSLFAMGIVTGDNKSLIKHTPFDGGEVIIKGADIEKYRVFRENSYITFTPDKFQQCAKENVYRSDEKILYRFIGTKPIFAYDNKKRLSLNSCNIIIPNIDNMDIKYILAVLNSTPTEFFLKKSFSSVKLLKSHIEKIPIPKASLTKQKEIILLVNQAINGKDVSKKIDTMVSDLFVPNVSDFFLNQIK